MQTIFDFFKNMGNNLLNSKFYFLWIPLLIGILGFMETVGFLGYFIPIDIISITYFAFIHKKFLLFVFSSFIFALSVFLGLLVGYFLGRKFYRKLILKIENKYPTIKDYFEEIDKKLDKYHLLAFPILINIGFTRPIMALHLGARHYNFGKFLIGSIIGTIFYVVPRVLIGYLVGIFGKIILDKLEIGFKYLIYIIVIIIIIAFVFDFIKEQKELKK